MSFKQQAIELFAFLQNMESESQSDFDERLMFLNGELKQLPLYDCHYAHLIIDELEKIWELNRQIFHLHLKMDYIHCHEKLEILLYHLKNIYHEKEASQLRAACIIAKIEGHLPI